MSDPEVLMEGGEPTVSQPSSSSSSASQPTPSVELAPSRATPSRRTRTNPMNVSVPSNWAAKWSAEEDQRLIEALKTLGSDNWKAVAEFVGTRDAIKCQQRWEKGLQPGIVKGRWSEEEDRNLVYLVSQGHKNWGKVADHMPGRTSKQCRERWNNYLDPTLSHTPFSAQEDELLLGLQAQHGNKWAHIARLLPGRTENAVKLRFNSLMNSGPQSSQRTSSRAARNIHIEIPHASSSTVREREKRTMTEVNDQSNKRPHSEGSPSAPIPLISSSSVPFNNPLTLLSSLAPQASYLPQSTPSNHPLSQFSALNTLSLSSFYSLPLQGLQGSTLLNPIMSSDYFQQQYRQQQLSMANSVYNSSLPLPISAPITAPVPAMDENDIEEEELSDSEDEG